jgi:pyridoxal phosphate enzyme (YggS family)
MGGRPSEGGGEAGRAGVAAAIRANLAALRRRVEAAAEAAGRAPDSVIIVGVTKTVGADQAAILHEAGLSDLGENRPEELLSKSSHPGLRGARWHLIGTYQRRKVRDTLGPIALIHSLDSTALARTVSERALDRGRVVDCLLQVNVSGESTKHGFGSEEAAAALDAMRALAGIRLRGLMTMAPLDASPADRRDVFARTRALRDRLRDRDLPLPELSMGMSGDFVEAVLEGATLIRVGTALFEGSQDRSPGVGSPGQDA